MVSPVFCLGLLLFFVMSLVVHGRPPPPDLTLEDYEYQAKNMGADYGEVDQTEEVEEVTGCVDYKSSPGIYKVFSEVPRSTPCGLYLVAPVDYQIELTFLDFQVDCQQNGVVEIVDGYAYGNGVFPPEEKNGRSTKGSRHKRHCGTQIPLKNFLSTTNAVVIQNRLPMKNQGFTVQVQFLKNPQPCNAVLMDEKGIVTLGNYGLNLNCSLLMLFPQRLSITFDYETKYPTASTKHSEQGQDYLEILGGNSSSVEKMISFERSTGTSSEIKIQRNIFCENVVVRLISSGRFISMAQISHETLPQDVTSGSSPSQCLV